MASAKMLMMAAALLVVSCLTFSSAAAPAAAPPPVVIKRYRLAAEGNVYCKSCKLPGYNKAIDASPLSGAVVKLKCNLTDPTLKKPYEVSGTTDKNGRFFILGMINPKVTNAEAANCKVFLVSSPLAFCKNPAVPGGAVLAYQRNVQIGTVVYSLFSAGNLLFAPTTPKACPKAST